MHIKYFIMSFLCCCQLLISLIVIGILESLSLLNLCILTNTKFVDLALRALEKGRPFTEAFNSLLNSINSGGIGSNHFWSKPKISLVSVN